MVARTDHARLIRELDELHDRAWRAIAESVVISQMYEATIERAFGFLSIPPERSDLPLSIHRGLLHMTDAQQKTAGDETGGQSRARM